MQRLLKDLHLQEGGEIVLVVADGLGGLGREPGGATELEAASTPNLDALAREGVTGLLDPVGPGITSGSGPGHLALFGYDPVEQLVGRGVLAALGVEFPLQDGDVAARGNFCTLDEDGDVRDRRAGRLSSEVGAELVDRLQHHVGSDDVEIFVEPVEEYRFVLVLRDRGGRRLAPELGATDPQRTGVRPRDPEPKTEEAQRTATIVREFVAQAREALAGDERADSVLLRGFSRKPDLPGLGEAYGLSALAVASYPMYRGLARLLGMDVAPPPADLSAAVGSIENGWRDHDYFFLHHKPSDSAGEDGDFDAKVAEIERVDAVIPELRALDPAVLIVTGDHSTPSRLASHSWHPVPIVLHATSCRRDEVDTFGERACSRGGLGRRPAQDTMALALAHAGRLRKFGA